MTGALLERLDLLAYPVAVLAVALVMLFGAHRLRFLGEKWIGVLGLLLVVGCLVMSFQSSVWCQLLFSAEHLPATAFLILTPVVAWFATPEEGASTLLAPIAPSQKPPLLDVGEKWVAVVTLLVVGCLAWWVEPPLGPIANQPLEPAKLPWFLAGWQEMRLVARPWLSWAVWPLLFGALLALPYLEPHLESRRDAEVEDASRRESTALFLLFGTVLGCVPMAVAVYLREADWRLVGLLGPREGEAIGRSLAEAFWQSGLGMTPPQTWLWRELPGCLAVAGYGAVLLVVLPRWRASRGVFGRYRKDLGETRYRLALIIFLVLGWVPLKLLLYWLLAIDDWVTLPFGWGGF